MVNTAEDSGFYITVAPEALGPKKRRLIMALWREVAGYEGLYAVSDEGEVISLPRVLSNGRGMFKVGGKLLKQGTRAGKYKFVHLSKDNVQSSVSVHRLVAIAFLDNPENLPEVNHKDENPSNNHVENLEWCSKQYNIDYSKSKKVSQYTMDGEKVAEYKSISYAADITGISRQAINNALSRWSKSAGRYTWKYEEED